MEVFQFLLEKKNRDIFASILAKVTSLWQSMVGTIGQGSYRSFKNLYLIFWYMYVFIRFCYYPISIKARYYDKKLFKDIKTTT